jgi:hypothetical protein
MLILTVRLGDGTEERVSFFEDADVQVEVTAGDTITYSMYHRGGYTNGRDLQVEQTAPAGEGTRNDTYLRVFAPGERPPLHDLSAAELEAFYEQSIAAGSAEPALLGQVSNQIRYARIEVLLRELLAEVKKISK